MRTLLLTLLLATTMVLGACDRETATAPPTATPTTPAPPPTPPPQEMPAGDLPADADPAGRAVPPAHPGRPVVEGEGAGAPGTRPGPTAR
jgi:hypothetical protein